MRLVLPVVFFLSCFSLFSLESDGLVEKLAEVVGTVEMAENLVRNSKLFHINYDGKEEGVPFQFKSTLLSNSRNILPLKNPLFSMEVLSLVKKANPNKQKNIANILCSISTLKGLEYYSPSRKKMRLLYRDSYVVEKENVKGKIKYMKVSDPIDKLKDKLSLFVFQEDLTFGKNIYEFTYLRENNGVALVVFNSDALYYSIFKAIEKRDLNSVFIAYDAGDYVLLYVSMKAKFKKIIGLENKLKNSFMARLDAMSKWFIDKYNE